VKLIRNLILSLLAVAVVGVASAAPVGATGCKVITNPGEAFFEWWTPPGGFASYPMGFSGSLTTGDSSSGCNDLNMANVSGPVCADASNRVQVVAQYWSNGGWVTDSQGLTWVNCGTGTLQVIGRGYANNATFRVLISIGSASRWPSFKLYV